MKHLKQLAGVLASGSGGVSPPPPPPPVTYDYANYGGEGHRLGLIEVTSAATMGAGKLADLVNGTYTTNSTWWNGGQTTVDVQFNFQNSRAINEVTFRQTDSSTHGTWKFQGSADAISWTDVGSSFTLGGSTVQVITEPSANTTAYQYYRLHQISGSTSSSPFLVGIDFQIGDEITKGYFGTYGVGDRHTSITITGPLAGAGSPGYVNGSYGHDSWLSGATPLHFDFGAPVALNECLWYQDNNTTHGSWQWEYSDDDSTWTSFGSSFTVGGGTQITSPAFVSRQTQLNGNVAAHQFWRLNTTGGSFSSSPYVEEIEFSTA